MGWLSSFFDNVVGLDPNGGGIYNTARDIVGDTIGDNILGLDPNGGGIVQNLNKAIPVLAGIGAGNLAGDFSGLTGWGKNAVSGATSSGVRSAFTGGNPVKDAALGALGPTVSGANPAGYAGIDNPTLANMFNKGVAGGAQTLLNGGDLKQAGTSAALGAGVPGLNAAGSFVGNLFNQFSGDEFGDLPGNMVTGNDPYNATPEMYSDEGARFDNSGDFSYGYQTPQQQGGNTLDMPPQQALSYSPMSANFSMPSMSSVGNFVGNNFGELATGLYGLYNNRRQQKAIGNQMNTMQNWYNQNAATNQNAMKTLENLYSNDSPYAKQLRNKITAQAAATGRRSNLAGRETQLQAALADKYASVLPQLTSMQNQQNNMGSALAQANLQAQAQRGTLQNRMMSNLLNMGNQTGLFKGLGSMFNPYNNDLSGYNNGGGM